MAEKIGKFISDIASLKRKDRVGWDQRDFCKYRKAVEELETKDGHI